MSSWENIKNNVTSFAKSAAKKTSELTDTAIFKVKISAKENEISNQYKALGALVYNKFKEEDTEKASALTERIAECVTSIDALKVQLDELNADYKEHIDKTKKKKSVNLSVAKSVTTERDEKVMSEFDKAREESNAEYIKATKLEIEAKELAADAQNESNSAMELANTAEQ